MRALSLVVTIKQQVCTITNSPSLCFLITDIKSQIGFKLVASWLQDSKELCKEGGAAEACSPALSFLALFFFPLGSCIGRLWEENTSFDRFIVERVVVSFFLCTTMLTDIV